MADTSRSDSKQLVESSPLTTPTAEVELGEHVSSTDSTSSGETKESNPPAPAYSSKTSNEPSISASISIDIPTKDADATAEDGDTQDGDSSDAIETPQKKGKKKHEKGETDGEEKKAVPLRQLYRYATPFDKLRLLVGAIAAAGAGAITPLMFILFGDALDAFGQPTEGGASFTDQINDLVIDFVYLAAASFVCTSVAQYSWSYTSESLTASVRREYMKSAMKQNVGWYDKTTPSVVITRLASDVALYQAGIGEKVSQLIQYTTTFFASLILGMIWGWQMTLVVLGVVPLLLTVMGLMGTKMTTLTKESLEVYEVAGEIASDALTLIRTVSAFAGQRHEAALYESKLEGAKKVNTKKALFTGGMLGSFMFILFVAYGVSLWFGAWLIRNDITSARTGEVFSGGDVISVFFVVLIGAMSIGQTGPTIPAILQAATAAHRLYEIIDRKSPIDASSKEGKKLEKLVGNIEFKNVDFRYPTRPDLQIYKDLNLSIDAGQTVAVVGVSGGGKSTMMSLLERFYDAEAGQVLVDGVDIKELNVKWWRRQIGFVQQEPVLFPGTIKENILYGLPEGSDEDVINAAKAADAHSFISKLEDGYDTQVGERGGMLSGGQKQRVAIARAVIKDPRILLLDEATSALDNESERVVQAALDNVMKGRTTIVVAHRLSTVRNADKTVVIQEGAITEEGSHDELMLKKGPYYHLVHAQVDANDDNQDKLVKQASLSRQVSLSRRSASRRSRSAIIHPTERKSDSPDAELDDDEDDIENSISVEEPVNDDQTIGELIRKASEMSISGLGALTVPGRMPNTAAFQNNGFAGTEKKAHDVELDDVSVSDGSGSDEDEVVKDTPKGMFASLKKFTNGFTRIPLGRIFGLVSHYWLMMIIGILCAGIMGAAFPMFSIVISDMIGVLFNTNKQEQEEDSIFLALIFLAIGTAQGIAGPVSHWCFGTIGEFLTMHFRVEAFRAMLRQEIAFFDNPKNSSSALTARLEIDSARIQQATVGALPTMMQTFVTVVVGLTIGLVYSWQISLLIIAISPLLFVGTVYGAKMMQAQHNGETKEADSESENLAAEATSNIRTVAAFTSEDFIYKLYSKSLEGNLREQNAKCAKGGVLFGLSQMAQFLVNPLVFWIGGILVDNGSIDFDQLLTAMFAMMMTAQSLGFASADFPDFNKAFESTINVFKLIDLKTSIDSMSTEGDKPDFTKTKIKFSNIEFAYPRRQNTPVLRDLTLELKGGTTLAMVGESGSGKSTMVSLLQRFYDPSAGNITVDGRDIRSLNVSAYREHIGVVNQEPSLFNRSIMDNIRYGNMNATDEECIEAAKNANIHESIMGFPEGYNTLCGTGGSQLSGGQKQRVAIARAIVRAPRILLLDEATSALDTESEKLVQSALDRLMHDKSANRATIVIAHRLSTVQKCDQIAVMEYGKLLEMGTHNELLAKNGVYANLTRAAAMKN